MVRTLDLAMRDRTPTRTLERTHEPVLERTRTHTPACTLAQVRHRLQDLAAGLAHDEAPAGAGLKVRLFDREREEERTRGREHDAGLGLGF